MQKNIYGFYDRKFQFTPLCEGRHGGKPFVANRYHISIHAPV